MNLHFPGSFTQLFKEWHHYFPGSLGNKPILGRLWAAIPKYLCWQIWLARNRVIFKEQKTSSARIAAKTIGMIIEKFAASNIKLPAQESIPEPYFSWCKAFFREKSFLQSNIIANRPARNRRLQPWEIRVPSKDFQSWLKERKIYAFFFDGASKGNPGVAGAGGGSFLTPAGKLNIPLHGG